jgi:hypothetical protein
MARLASEDWIQLGLLVMDSMSVLGGQEDLRLKVHDQLWGLSPSSREALRLYVGDVAGKLDLDAHQVWSAIIENTPLSLAACARIRDAVDEDLRGLDLAERISG